MSRSYCVVSPTPGFHFCYPSLGIRFRFAIPLPIAEFAVARLSLSDEVPESVNGALDAGPRVGLWERSASTNTGICTCLRFQMSSIIAPSHGQFLILGVVLYPVLEWPLMVSPEVARNIYRVADLSCEVGRQGTDDGLDTHLVVLAGVGGVRAPCVGEFDQEPPAFGPITIVRRFSRFILLAQLLPLLLLKLGDAVRRGSKTSLNTWPSPSPSGNQST